MLPFSLSYGGKNNVTLKKLRGKGARRGSKALGIEEPYDGDLQSYFRLHAPSVGHHLSAEISC